MASSTALGHSGYHSDRPDLVGKTLFCIEEQHIVGTIESAHLVGLDAASGLLSTRVIIRSQSGVAYDYYIGQRYRIID